MATADAGVESQLSRTIMIFKELPYVVFGDLMARERRGPGGDPGGR